MVDEVCNLSSTRVERLDKLFAGEALIGLSCTMR